MEKTPDNVDGSVSVATEPTAIEKRVFRVMQITTGIALVASIPLANWRISLGLLLGGVLALLNHRWLNNSAKASFSVLVDGKKPRMRLIQYFLRYAVIAGVVFIAYQLNLVSLPATIVGLCTFVVALFVEAIREFYFAIIHREEIS